MEGRLKVAAKLALSFVAAAVLSSVSPAARAADKPVIALANSYYGNSWRHQMVVSFETAAKAAKEKGLISDYIILNGDGSVNQQSAQLSSLILKKVNVILLDAASETALNGLISKACGAGVTVISFDSIATGPCAYQVKYDFTTYQKRAAEYIAKKLNGKGNVAVVRGVKGAGPDTLMYNAHMDVLKNYPGIKVAATVFGGWSAPDAQAALAAVLPSLPTLDAVLTQGGNDDFGVVQALQQFGGPYKDKMPLINGGNDADFLHWWAAENAKNGYDTLSMSPTPAIGGAMVWLALDVLNGTKIKKDITIDVLTVSKNDLPKWSSLGPGENASPAFDADWVNANIVQPNKE
jgi:ribose transport system substrate-binding protein